MFKRWKVTVPGEVPGLGDGIEVVAASDYDALAGECAALRVDRDKWRDRALSQLERSMIATSGDGTVQS